MSDLLDWISWPAPAIISVLAAVDSYAGWPLCPSVCPSARVGLATEISHDRL